MKACGSKADKLLDQKFSDTTMCHSPSTSNDYTCALQCPGSGLRPLRSHHHLPLQSLSPSLDVASHGYLQHVYWSTTSRPYPGPKTMHLHELHPTSKSMSDTGNWKPGCQNNPRSSQSGPGQSEWPQAEKGAARCGSIWIRWTFMPRFHVSICKVHSPHSADFFAEKKSGLTWYSELWMLKYIQLPCHSRRVFVKHSI